MVELKVVLHYENYRKELVYKCNEYTKVEDFLIYLYDNYVPDNLKCELFGIWLMIYNFSFINLVYGGQKAKLSYPLLEFINNFDYDINNINIKYEFIYGIGGGFEFESIASIRVNSNEPKHHNPHVHITRIGKMNPSFRIDLATMTQMKGDSISWKKEFKLKERKRMLDFLMLNKDEMQDYYNRCLRGEYIDKEYLFYYNGKEYCLNKINVYFKD